MSGLVNNMVQINCTYKKVTSFVFGLLGFLCLVCVLMNTGHKSVYTGSVTGVASNVITQTSEIDGKKQYSVTMNMTYEFEGKSVMKKLTSSNNTYVEGQNVPLLYNPETGDAIIKAEHSSPSLMLFISIPFLCSCILTCAVTFYMTTTPWGCKALAFSSGMQFF
jgi:hypothetical protein